MRHHGLILFFLFVIVAAISAQGNEGSDDSTGSEPLPSGTVTVIGGEAQIEEVTRWEDGAPEGVEFRGSGRIEIIILWEAGEDPYASVVYYALDVFPSLHTDPEERFRVEVGGVVIGLQNFPKAQKIPTGEVTYRALGRADLFEKSSVYFPLEDTYEPTIPVRLTASLDQGRGTWGLYVKGERWMTDLPYTPGEEKIVLESNGELSTKVRNMNISSINPFESG